MAKRIDLFTSGEETIPEALSSLPDVELTEAQLCSVCVEVRITPEELEDETLRQGYQVEVYLWYGDEQMEISEWIPSLHVCLAAEELQQEAERATFAAAFAVTAIDADGSERQLASVLAALPVYRMDDLPDVAEYFEGSFDREDGEIVILYNASVPVEPYRRYALCAAWAGNAVYRLAQAD